MSNCWWFLFLINLQTIFCFRQHAGDQVVMELTLQWCIRGAFHIPNCTLSVIMTPLRSKPPPSLLLTSAVTATPVFQTKPNECRLLLATQMMLCAMETTKDITGQSCTARKYSDTVMLSIKDANPLPPKCQNDAKCAVWNLKGSP